MSKHVLITGGAGFVGSHLADELLSHGYRVRALDNLAPQVHGEGGVRPPYLHPDVELMVGDVRNRATVDAALKGIDFVCHLAAVVGVGQSMYEIVRYTDVNNLGTAVLLEALIARPVEGLLVASSMSLYGEGMYRTTDGRTLARVERSRERLAQKLWEPCDEHGEELTPIPTPEEKTPAISSIYALSKYDQEKLCLITGEAYGIPTVAMRFFNIYGPRQALSNPYTGALAIFASRLLNNRSPIIYEDGRQQRDFISVHDIARACRLALETRKARGQVFNVGTGQRHTIGGLAEQIARALGKEQLQPELTGGYRAGDIRHCFADISHAREILGFEPQVQLQQGIVELADWLVGQTAVDRAEEARAELAARGLTT